MNYHFMRAGHGARASNKPGQPAREPFWGILRTMPRFPVLAALLLSLSLALAPAVAHARAGSSMSRGSVGMSQGSAGSRTYSPSIGAPMQRSVTPHVPSSPSPVYRPTPSYGSGYGSGFFGGGFMSGLFGGLIGAGIGHMLFGGGYGGGYGGLGFGGILGSLLHLMLWGVVIWFVFRIVRRMFGGGPVFNTGYQPDYGNQSTYTPYAGGSFGGAAPAQIATETIPIADADYNNFSRLLVDIQNAWSRGDLNAMRRFMTPEMLGYFSEELSRNASDGVENRVEDVQFQNGSVQQAWREDDIEYASALISWLARDYYVRNDRNPGDRDYVAKGDPQRPVSASELWTFMRHRGGNWVLSAIQQV
jgi:predicted lipid-binding transport protein (Tim44 family)